MAQISNRSHAAFTSADGVSFQNAPAKVKKCDKPVDLVHLSRQSLGDRSLENEILRLFLNQSKLYLQRLQSAKSADERKMAAHTILGSARGIGAWDVAHHAELAQTARAGQSSLAELAEAVEAANLYIQELLQDQNKTH